MTLEPVKLVAHELRESAIADPHAGLVCATELEARADLFSLRFEIRSASWHVSLRHVLLPFENRGDLVQAS